jgi:hypothetical protein
VLFGGVPAQSFRVDSLTRITAVVGNGAMGAVTVRTANFFSATTNAQFSFIGTPTITNIQPQNVGLNQDIVITGTNFFSTTTASLGASLQVSLGGATASSVVINSPTQLTVRFVNPTSGTLTVRAQGGTSTSQIGLNILPAPTVTGFSPSLLGQNSPLTLSGTNFVVGQTQVVLNGVVLGVTVNSPTRATVIIPANAQSGTLTVRTPGGTGSTSQTLTVIPPPMITAVQPSGGAVGTRITITGQNLASNGILLIGGIPTTFTVSGTGGSITALLPALPNDVASSQATVRFTSIGGTATFGQSLTILPPAQPTITSIEPNPILEGATVTVRLAGTNATTSISGISIGGVAVTDATLQADGRVRFTVPFGVVSSSATLSQAALTLTTTQNGRTSTTTADILLTVQGANVPSLSGFSPQIGSSTTTLTITGQNLGTAPRGSIQAVFVGGVRVQSFRVVSPNQIQVTLGTVTSGTITVQTSSGALSTSGTFTFDPRSLPYVVVSAQDSTALAALYNATNGAKWANATNWLTEPVSTWRGVVLDSGRVVEVRLAANNLRGQLPVNDLRQLTALRVLDIGDNALTGDVSSLLGSLRNLGTLRLSNNAFTGSLDGLCGMANLRELDLAGCGMTGSLAVFCCLNRIERLNISRNRFSGEIPPCLGDKQTLAVFDASNNQLSGALPALLGNAESLQTLNLSNNQLSGVIPNEFGAPVSSGKQVAALAALRSLQRLDLSQNRFSGAVPQALGSLTNLRELRLSGNQFSGTLPAEMLQLQRLTVLDASNNRLSDAPAFKEIARLDSLRLDGNAMNFSVLERQVGVRNFRYAPQQITPPALSDTTVLSDMPLTLRAGIPGANNRYQWRKNGSILAALSAKDSLGFAAFAAADSGRYSCEITNTALPLLVVTTASALVRVIPPVAEPDSVVIIAPLKGETEVPTLPTLQWTTLAGAAQYRIEFSQNAVFTPLLTSLTIVQSLPALASGIMEVDTRGLNGFPLQPEARYFWRVRAENLRGSGRWAVGDFGTGANTTLSAQRVDFGKVPRGDTAFATLNLRNQSSRPVRIADVITTSNAAFAISDVRNSVIPAESSVSVRVRFIPATLDAVNAGITVRFQAEGSATVQTQTISARLFGRGGALKLIAPATDTSVIGTTKLMAVQVVNVGDRELEIVRVDLRRGSREYSFRASVDGQLPVGAGDTASVLLKFVADRMGAASPEMIYCQANIDTVTTPLIQFGRMQLPSDVVAGIGIRTVPPASAPGALVMVELFLTETNPADRDKLFRSGVPFFTASVRMNRQVLVPNASGSALMRAVRNTSPRNTMQRYSIPTTYWNGRDSVLLRVPCRVVAGSTDATALVLEQIQWGDGSLQLSTITEGMFKSTASQAGGKRLIAPSVSKIAIIGITPNPATNEVEIAFRLATSLDGAPLETEILDMRGQVVYQVVNWQSQLRAFGEVQNLRLGVSDLPSGTYNVRLRIGGEVALQTLKVVR